MRLSARSLSARSLSARSLHADDLPAAGDRRLLLVEAAAWIVTARLLLALVPFARIARRLGRLYGPGTGPAAGHDPGQVQQVSHAVSRAIVHASQRLPFEVSCLPRALAGSQMLHRRGLTSDLHFGPCSLVAGKRPELHAWLTVAGLEVTGFPVASSAVELGFYRRL